MSATKLDNLEHRKRLTLLLGGFCVEFWLEPANIALHICEHDPVVKFMTIILIVDFEI